MSDKQLRPPPAYSVYASDDLASSRYYGLSVGERGLLDSMNRAYWIERSLPRDPNLLARVLRLEAAEVARHLTQLVLSHFVAGAVDADDLHSIELQRQYRNIVETRAKQAIGGKIGAQMTNEGKRARRKPKQHKVLDEVTSTPASQGAGSPPSQVRVPERTELKELNSSSSLENRFASGVDVARRTQFKGGASQIKSPEHRAFVAAYEAVEQTTAQAPTAVER